MVGNLNFNRTISFIAESFTSCYMCIIIIFTRKFSNQPLPRSWAQAILFSGALKSARTVPASLSRL